MAQNAPSPPPQSPGPTLQLTRTRSPKDRIQDILEDAPHLQALACWRVEIGPKITRVPLRRWTDDGNTIQPTPPIRAVWATPMASLAEAIFGPSANAVFSFTGARERAESRGTNSADVSPRLRPLLGRERGLSDPSGSTAPHDLDGHGVVTTQPERVRSLNYLGTAETSPVARRRSAQSRKPSGQQQHGQPQSHGAAPSEAGEHRERTRDQQEGPLWKRTLRYFKSIELENKGSVARDHLALERTFLAWLRTSLAFASIGIAITQLFRLNTSLSDNTEQAETLRHLGKPLGTTFLAVSILILLLGYNRYLQGQYWVIRGKFPASRGTIMIVSFIAFSVTVASLIVILAVQSNPL